jgi:hypothetical protein
LETNFSCFAKLDGCQVGLPNCWRCSKSNSNNFHIPSPIGKK